MTMDAEVPGGIRDTLRVIAGAGGHHAARALRLREPRNAVVCAADLETENRLQILPLQQHGVVQPAREARSLIERRLSGHFIDAAREDLAQQGVHHAIFIR
jgi:hypothetical protein